MKIPLIGLIASIEGNEFQEELLDLSYQKLTISNATSLAKALEGNNCIKSIRFCGCDIGDDAAQILSEIPKKNGIEEFDLSNNQISLIGAGYLANSKLSKLKISGNLTLGDKGIEILSKSTTLRELSAADCNITNIGASEIFKNNFLTKLDLNTNQISSEGMATIISNNTLQELNLFQNYIGDEGAKLVSGNQSLKIVNLASNWIKDEGAIALENSKAEELNLGNNQITGKGFLALCKNQYIQVLSLFDNHISFEGIEKLPLNITLTELHLNYNKIKDEPSQPLMDLVSFPKLRVLNIGNNNLTEKGVLLFRKESEALERFDLESNGLNSKSLMTFAYNLKRPYVGFEETSFEKDNLPPSKKIKLSIIS